MTKFILRVFSWLLVVGVCSAQTSGGAQNCRLTHELTVGSAHDIHLKGGQTVRVLSQSASTVVIMVQLSDGSNGVYQVGPGDIDLSQQEDNNPPPAANSTAAGGEMAAPTGNEMPTLSQIKSLPRRLSLVAAVSPQNLDIKTGSDEKLQIDALPKGTVLIPLGIQGDSLVVLIHARLVTSELVDPNWNNTSLNVNVAPHPVTHTREVNGKGLIPLSDTDYNQVVVEAQEHNPRPPLVSPSTAASTSSVQADSVIQDVSRETNSSSLDMLNKTTHDHPDDFHAWAALAEAYQGKGMTKEELDACAHMFELAPEDSAWSIIIKDKKIDGLAAVFDKELPDKVMEALRFIRTKVNQAIPNGNETKFLIIPACNVLTIISPGNMHQVSIKDLDPSAIYQRDNQLGDGTIIPTAHSLTLWTTYRKDTATFAVFEPTTGTIFSAKKEEGVQFETLSDKIDNQRVAKAFSDIISFYGGQEEKAVSDLNTVSELVEFIQNKLNKGGYWSKVILQVDPKVGTITITCFNSTSHAESTSKPSFVITIDASKLQPDDFRWDKSGDNESWLTVRASDMQFMANESGSGVPADGQVHVGNQYSFKCADEQDANDAASALQKIAEKYGWTPPKY